MLSRDAALYKSYRPRRRSFISVALRFSLLLVARNERTLFSVVKLLLLPLLCRNGPNIHIYIIYFFGFFF